MRGRGLDWSGSGQGRLMGWCERGNKVRVPWNAGIFDVSWGTLRFPRRTVYCGKVRLTQNVKINTWMHCVGRT